MRLSSIECSRFYANIGKIDDVVEYTLYEAVEIKAEILNARRLLFNHQFKMLLENASLKAPVVVGFLFT